MIVITAGMTPAQFVTALNSSFDAELYTYDLITSTMTGAELKNALNSNFGNSEIYTSKSGINYINSINSNFTDLQELNEASVSLPENFAIVCEDDFVKLSWDNNIRKINVEIWESKNSEPFILAHTYTGNSGEYEYKTWQNASLDFKIRGKKNTTVSEFSSVETISTPLVIIADQTELAAIIINYLWVKAGKTVIVDWGDGDTDTITATSGDLNLTHNYSEAGSYFIQISGDTNDITYLLSSDYTVENCRINLEKWVLPVSLRGMHLLGVTFYGDLTDFVLPSTLEVFLVQAGELTGDITNWDLPTGIYDFHLEINDLIGDISGWTMPPNISHFIVYGNLLYGDISELSMPNSNIMSNVILNLSNTDVTGDISALTLDPEIEKISLNGCIVTGDLSTMLIPEGTKSIELSFNDGPQLTKLPRGNFRWVKEYTFHANACLSAEIDSVLADIDLCFINGVVPLINGLYDLSGDGMGIPSAAGLISRTSIIDKYTAAGKTCTIAVNS